MKDLSGYDLYVYEGFKVEILPYFLYELSISKYWKNGYCLISSKFYKIDKPLSIKHYNVFRKFNGYLIGKELTPIGVTQEFANYNNLQKYIPKKKIKKK